MGDAVKSIGSMFSPAYMLGDALFGGKKKDKEPKPRPVLDDPESYKSRLDAVRQMKQRTNTIYGGL